MAASLNDTALMATIRISYQPVVRLADLRTDYVEVLARAEDEDGLLTGPEAIVDAMTFGARSMRLTGFIMQAALREYVAYGFGRSDLGFAFNLPLDAMMEPGLVSRIDGIRARLNLPASNIRFELTERHPVHDLRAADAVIAALHEAHYGLALDDVTPEMVNLPALMGMKVNAIKLDRSVVTGGERVGFIREIVAGAKARGQAVIAEGIETDAILTEMRELGVSHGQGFLFSRPLLADGLQAFLTGEHPQEALAGVG